MPRSSTGKWVTRAAATGGGRTYRGQRPVNWYAALVIVVVLGVLSIVYARYQYQNPSAAASSTVQPTTKTTWYAGFDFYVCGKQLAPVASNAKASSASQSFYTAGKGVITIAPKTASEAGHNAVLGKFVGGYHGMALTSSEVKVPSSKSAATYHDGQACPAGTPDAGKKGSVQVAYWPNAFNTKGKAVTVTGNPATLRFSANQLITIGFVPKGATLPKPDGTVVTALVQVSTSLGGSASTTTTTAPGTTSTTAPGSTKTTAPGSTSTTAPVTTTTIPKK
ncbi:MAG: hypothetical protein ACRDWN_01070 [Acidimicrobiales bacterium]